MLPRFFMFASMALSLTLLSFNPTYAAGKDRSIQTCRSLAPGRALNIDLCGAKADGKTDDADAITAALSTSRDVTCTPGNTYIVRHTVTISVNGTRIDAERCRFAPQLQPSTEPIFDVEASHIALNDLHFIAGTGGWGLFAGFTKPVSDISVNGEICDGTDNPPMSGCNQIAAVSNFSLKDWKIKAAGYGLLQKSGTNSHDVKVIHFQASDMYADLIAENSVTGTSDDWTINDGRFDGAHGYPHPATEQRFASFTTANQIMISNVVAQHANGDSAIHLEGTAKNLSLREITLKDNLATGGSDAYITYNSSANTIDAKDVSCIYSSSGNAPYCFGGGGNAYANKLIFSDINCVDITGRHEFGCFELMFHSAQVSISGGNSRGLLRYLTIKNSSGPIQTRQIKVIDTKMMRGPG